MQQLRNERTRRRLCAESTTIPQNKDSYFICNEFPGTFVAFFEKISAGKALERQLCAPSFARTFSVIRRAEISLASTLPLCPNLSAPFANSLHVAVASTATT